MSRRDGESIPPQRDASHLQQSGVVGVGVLVLSLLRVHLVPLAGPGQLLGVVEEGGVQRVSVDQAHQIFPVVLPAKTRPRRT